MPLSPTELTNIETNIAHFIKSTIGPIIKAQSGKSISQHYDDKASPVDFVTKYDKQIEKLIREFTSTNYPDFEFIGEEEYVPGETKIGDKPTFIVDPIDGTTNFIHGFPYSCCSVGLAEGGKPVVGVIYNPNLDLLLQGSKGNGAFANGERIEVTERPLKLGTALLALEGGAERVCGKDGEDSNFDIKMATYKNLLSANGGLVHGFRSLGSAAMNISYVCMGIFDAFWEGGCWAWDVCAGTCILQETGGVLVGGNKGEWDIPLDRRVYFAVRGGCTKDEQKKFIEDFWEQVAGELKY